MSDIETPVPGTVLIFDDVDRRLIRLALDPESMPDEIDVTHWHDGDPSNAYCGKDVSDDPEINPEDEKIVCSKCYLLWADEDSRPEAVD